MQSPRLTLRGGLFSPSPFRCAAPSKHIEQRRELRLEGKASKRASKGDMRVMGRKDEEGTKIKRGAACCSSLSYSCIVWDCERKLLTSLSHNLLQTRIGPARTIFNHLRRPRSPSSSVCSPTGGLARLSLPAGKIEIGAFISASVVGARSPPLHSSPPHSAPSFPTDGWIMVGGKCVLLRPTDNPPPLPSLSAVVLSKPCVLPALPAPAGLSSGAWAPARPASSARLRRL